jgi:sugar-specific transcriptional regulator TrmB
MMSLEGSNIRGRIVSRLKGLDLTTHEAQSFLALLSNPSATASTLCSETGIPDSKIYYALEGLTKKGIIAVQRGTPNIYMALPPEEAVSNLKSQLSETYHERMREADALLDMLVPIYDAAQKSESYEIAYIIRGQSNIINRMKSLIKTAHDEITVFIAFPEVLKGIRDSLVEAKKKRKVRVNLALNQEVAAEADISELGDFRLLDCSVGSLGMLISDMTTLLTVSDWMDGAALLTQDRNLIRVTKDYYDNPACCSSLS